ncbi:MAG: ABC transporter family substrate-binding protein [Pseudonocardiales bacterium]|nr:ABC transporter family substrate-binding protein [Pseudonocardiales bacterium]MBV9030734.1 ABC transporter family substrate-binding protein [Pseudonocardiales bacterium]MBW0008508.1 ABC transporter family substrate-binding protein [Pseudonocardiales bacterium]
MRRSGARYAVALVVGATVLLAACGGGGRAGGGQRQTGSAFAACEASPNTCNSARPGTLRQGGQLTFVIEKNVANWNLLASEGNVFENGEVLKAVLPYTFVTQPDLTVAMNTGLLDSAKVTGTSPETIVYKIKKDAVWSDGTPITAEDFSYNWKVQNGRDCPGCPAYTTSGYDQVQSVVGSEGGKTVTATLTKPFTDWKQLWGGGSPIYPAHVAARHGDITTPQGLAASFTWFEKNTPTYSGGPYRIDDFTNNESVTLVPNPRWYGPRPKLDRLIYRIITDANQEPTALQNREVQVIYPQPQVDLVQQVRRIPGVSSFIGLGLNWEHFDLNLQNSYLADPALRTAMFTAVDRQAIIDKTVGQFTNKVKPMNSHNFIPQQSGYEDVVSETGQGSGNLARARQILAAAGYKIDGDRLTTPIGMSVPPMRIRYTIGNQIRQVECELFAQAVKPLGITVQVVPTDDLGATTSRGDYDIVVFAWDLSPFPYGGAVQLWGTGQGDNFGHYSNPDVDRLIAAAGSQTDASLAEEMLNQADRRLTKDAYVLPLYQKPTFIALYDDIANVRDDSSQDGPPYNVAEWALRPTS